MKIKRMKRLFQSIAALALAIGFISCEKSITDDISTVAKTYKVNFSVSDKPSFDNTTRASKEGWAEGDQILVMLRPENGSYLIAANDNSKTLKLTYNGSKWSASTPSDEMMQALGTNGDCYAVYYRGNVGIGAEKEEDCYWFANYKGGEYYYSSGSYTVANDELTLTQIEMTKGTDIFQISVKNLLSTAENQAKAWKLAILRDATQKLPIPADFGKNDDLVYYEGMAEGYFMFDFGKTSPQTIFYATSVQNGDDATFWFCHPFYNEDEDVVNDKTAARYANGYFFTLTDGTTTYYYKVERNLDTAEEKTLNPEEAYLLPALSSWTEREDADWDRTTPNN